jgi:uncharacterized protein (TIGR02391 family)
MAKTACFSDNNVEQIARTLEAEISHAALGRYFAAHDIESLTLSTSSARWSRITASFLKLQAKHGCSNHLCQFVIHLMEPVRFRGRPQEFRKLKDELNEILSYNGMQLGDDGRLRPVPTARTLTEAQEMVGRLRAELIRRGVHPDVLRFCREELLQRNYFHAVLEATKSVADKIRAKSGLTSDGSELVNRAFSTKTPVLAINSLRTETERMAQTGFANLLKGTFETFRNPHAHAPRVFWPISEEDALDLLTLVSLLHRRLDTAVAVPGAMASAT